MHPKLSPMDIPRGGKIVSTAPTIICIVFAQCHALPVSFTFVQRVHAYRLSLSVQQPPLSFASEYKISLNPIVPTGPPIVPTGSPIVCMLFSFPGAFSSSCFSGSLGSRSNIIYEIKPIVMERANSAEPAVYGPQTRSKAMTSRNDLAETGVCTLMQSNSSWGLFSLQSEFSVFSVSDFFALAPAWAGSNRSIRGAFETNRQTDSQRDRQTDRHTDR